MTIVPVAWLCRRDMLRLGNNVLGVVMRDRRRSADVEAANRSLAVHGEAVDELLVPPVHTSPDADVRRASA